MKDEFLLAVSSELKIVRIEHNDSQEELAEKCGVATSTISKYEAGDKNMNLYKIEQMISSYDLNLYIFFQRIIAKTQLKS